MNQGLFFYASIFSIYCRTSTDRDDRHRRLGTTASKQIGPKTAVLQFANMLLGLHEKRGQQIL
jgi:hypothetical protein